MKKYTTWFSVLLFCAYVLPAAADGWKVNLDDNTVLMEHLKVGNPSEATTSSGGHVGHYISTQVVSPFAVDVRDLGITTSSSAATNTSLWNANVSANKKYAFPAGTFNFDGNSLYLYDNVTITGTGAGATILVSAVTGVTPFFRKHTSLGAVTGVSIGKLTLKGTDGSGGVALHLDSFVDGYFPHLTVDMFRNASDNGIGLYMTNDNGVCARNKFVGLTVNNSDNGIVLDSTNGTYSVGYNTFVGTNIGQEVNSIRLLSTNANGSIYNQFYGVFFQGNGNAGTYLDIEGSGNEILGVILDGSGSGTHLSFTKTTTQGNRVAWLTGLDVSKIVDNHSSGAPNTLLGNTQYYGVPGAQYGITDPLGALTFAYTATGTTGGIDIYLGNDTATNLWRWEMQASATPTFTLRYGASVSTQWNRSGDLTQSTGDFIAAAAGKGVILHNAADNVTKRVRLNDAGDGLVYEDP